MFKPNKKGYLIKTPTGYESFKGVQKKIVDTLITIFFTDGTYIKCSSKHGFEMNGNIVIANDINIGDILNCKKIVDIKKEYGEFEVFDPVGVDKHSLYYSNDVVSHNTEFIGSNATLVSGTKLRMLAFMNPILTFDNFDIYEDVQKDHFYIATVDCSEGVGHDYSSVNVFDVSSTPYRQVAKYRNNRLPLLLFPNVIYSIGMRYNEAFLLIETNSIGQQVVDILHYDLEYDNLFKSEQHHIKGQSISAGFKKSATIGVKTTKSVKKIGCANLKTLVESDKLIINDFDTIAELNSFVRIRDSYAAEEGSTDDLVMGLVLFSWLTAQSYFKDSTDIDIRKILLDEQELFSEENMLPVGFLSDGQEKEVIIDGNDVWIVDNDNDSTFRF